MRITLLPSSVTGERRNQYLTSFLINDTIAIDAGSLGFYASPQRQAKIRHVLVTHTHVDHIASLPIFVENAYEAGPEGVTIHGSPAVLECLRNDVFNDRVWPDFLRISPPGAPFMRFEILEPGRPLSLEGIRFTPVDVDHLVPTLGLILEEPGATAVIPSDTAPTSAIWQAANQAPDLKAVFLEVAFPNAMAGLAGAAKHLTPEMFGTEVHKIRPGVRVLGVHLKARFYDTITAEVAALGLTNVEICRPGEEYVF